MNKKFNIEIVGLGQIGIYLYNELNNKTKENESSLTRILSKLFFKYSLLPIITTIGVPIPNNNIFEAYDEKLIVKP